MIALKPQIDRWAPLAVLAGCLALAARVPSYWAVVITAAVGLIGALLPVTADRTRRLSPRWVVLIGAAPILIANSWLRPSFAQTGAVVLLASLIAAVAEEIFFRRLVYGWLARWGALAAIVGAAVLFALVHVPAYGPAALPLNFAAGLIFGWQRWATGSWEASAATHTVANLLGAF